MKPTSLRTATLGTVWILGLAVTSLGWGAGKVVAGTQNAKTITPSVAQNSVIVKVPVCSVEIQNAFHDMCEAKLAGHVAEEKYFGTTVKGQSAVKNHKADYLAAAKHFGTGSGHLKEAFTHFDLCSVKSESEAFLVTGCTFTSSDFGGGCQPLIGPNLPASEITLSYDGIRAIRAECDQHAKDNATQLAGNELIKKSLFMGAAGGAGLIGVAAMNRSGGNNDPAPASTPTFPTSCPSGQSLSGTVCIPLPVVGSNLGGGGPSSDSSTETVQLGQSTGMRISGPSTPSSPDAGLTSGANSSDVMGAVGRGSGSGSVSVAGSGSKPPLGNDPRDTSNNSAISGGRGLASVGSDGSASFMGYGGMGEGGSRPESNAPDGTAMRLERIGSACTTTALVDGKQKKINCLNFPGLKECKILPVGCRAAGQRRAKALQSTQY